MKKFLPVIVAAVAIILLVGGGFYFYFSSNNAVYTAYYNFSKSVKNKNLNEVNKYMDMDKVVDSYFENIKEVLGDLAKKEDLKEELEKSIKEGKFVKESSLATSQKDARENKKLEKDGDSFKLKAESGQESPITIPMDLYFTKVENDWKVTKLNMDLKKVLATAFNISSSSSSSASSVQEVKIGSEISTPVFKIKATKLEYFPSLETKKSYGDEKVIFKPRDSKNILAKISFEVTNISNSGAYVPSNLAIETADNKTYKYEYRDESYFFEQIPEGKIDLNFGKNLNPGATGYMVKIIEVPSANKESQKIVYEDNSKYPSTFYKWSN